MQMDRRWPQHFRSGGTDLWPSPGASETLLTLRYRLAPLHAHRRQVRVERLHAEAVIDDHAVAVDAEIVGKHNDPAVRREHRRPLHRGEVEAEVHLFVDFLVVMEVGSSIGKA